MSSQVITLIANINRVILNPIKGFMFTLALVIFLWGLVQFIWKADSDKDRDVGRQHMMWGIIGLFIMVAVVAIINIFLNTFGIQEVQTQFL